MNSIAASGVNSTSTLANQLATFANVVKKNEYDGDAGKKPPPEKLVTKRNVSGSSFESMVDSLKSNGYWSNPCVDSLQTAPDTRRQSAENLPPKCKAVGVHRRVRSVRSGDIESWFKSIGTIGTRREGGEVTKQSDIEAEMLGKRGSGQSNQSTESGCSRGMKSTTDVSPLMGHLDTEYKGDSPTLAQLWESSSAPMHWRDQEAFLTHTEVNNRRQSRQRPYLSPSASVSPKSKDSLDGEGDCDIQPLSLDMCLDEPAKQIRLRKVLLFKKNPFALKVDKVDPLDGAMMRIKKVKDVRLNSHGNLRDVLDIEFIKPNGEIVVSEALARPRCGGTPYERKMMRELREGQEREAKEVRWAKGRQKVSEEANMRERFEATMKMLRGWK